jgi:hypothetical protein
MSSPSESYKKILTSFIGIIPDSKCSAWEPIQQIRNKYIVPVRCYPHISMMDPFIENKHLKEAKEHIRALLVDFQPFTIKLAIWDTFKHNASCTLWLKPECDPPNALHELSARLLKAYPYCDDVANHPNGFNPHMSMGMFTDQRIMFQVKELVEQTWEPVEFLVKEIYMLTWIGFGPYQVREVIPLGPEVTAPCYDPVPLITEEDTVIMIDNMPKKVVIEDQQLLDVFKDYNPTRVDIKRARKKCKGFGMIEFPSHEVQQQVLTRDTPFIMDGHELKLRPSVPV